MWLFVLKCLVYFTSLPCTHEWEAGGRCGRIQWRRECRLGRREAPGQASLLFLSGWGIMLLKCLTNWPVSQRTPLPLSSEPLNQEKKLQGCGRNEEGYLKVPCPPFLADSSWLSVAASPGVASLKEAAIKKNLFVLKIGQIGHIWTLIWTLQI